MAVRLLLVLWMGCHQKIPCNPPSWYGLLQQWPRLFMTVSLYGISVQEMVLKWCVLLAQKNALQNSTLYLEMVWLLISTLIALTWSTVVVGLKLLRKPCRPLWPWRISTTPGLTRRIRQRLQLSTVSLLPSLLGQISQIKIVREGLKNDTQSQNKTSVRKRRRLIRTVQY